MLPISPPTTPTTPLTTPVSPLTTTTLATSRFPVHVHACIMSSHFFAPI